jgi:hypothetical protein
MSQIFNIKKSIGGGGITVTDNRDVTADNIIIGSEPIPAGVAGTGAAASAITMPTGHGFTDGQVVCVSGTFGAYYNGTISLSGQNTITVTGGAGDTLPTSGAVVVSLQVEIDMGFLGTNMAVISVGGDIALETTLETSGAVQLVKATAANASYQWDSGSGDVNPITGDAIVKAHVYNRGVAAGTITILVGYDND